MMDLESSGRNSNKAYASQFYPPIFDNEPPPLDDFDEGKDDDDFADFASFQSTVSSHGDGAWNPWNESKIKEVKSDSGFGDVSAHKAEISNKQPETNNKLFNNDTISLTEGNCSDVSHKNTNYISGQSSVFGQFNGDTGNGLSERSEKPAENAKLNNQGNENLEDHENRKLQNDVNSITEGIDSDFGSLSFCTEVSGDEKTVQLYEQGSISNGKDDENDFGDFNGFSNFVNDNKNLQNSENFDGTSDAVLQSRDESELQTRCEKFESIEDSPEKLKQDHNQEVTNSSFEDPTNLQSSFNKIPNEDVDDFGDFSNFDTNTTDVFMSAGSDTVSNAETFMNTDHKIDSIVDFRTSQSLEYKGTLSTGSQIQKSSSNCSTSPDLKCFENEEQIDQLQAADEIKNPSCMDNEQVGVSQQFEVGEDIESLSDFTAFDMEQKKQYCSEESEEPKKKTGNIISEEDQNFTKNVVDFSLMPKERTMNRSIGENHTEENIADEIHENYSTIDRRTNEKNFQSDAEQNEMFFISSNDGFSKSCDNSIKTDHFMRKESSESETEKFNAFEILKTDSDMLLSEGTSTAGERGNQDGNSCVTSGNDSDSFEAHSGTVDSTNINNLSSNIENGKCSNAEVRFENKLDQSSNAGGMNSFESSKAVMMEHDAKVSGNIISPEEELFNNSKNFNKIQHVSRTSPAQSDETSVDKKYICNGRPNESVNVVRPNNAEKSSDVVGSSICKSPPNESIDDSNFDDFGDFENFNNTQQHSIENQILKTENLEVKNESDQVYEGLAVSHNINEASSMSRKGKLEVEMDDKIDDDDFGQFEEFETKQDLQNDFGQGKKEASTARPAYNHNDIGDDDNDDFANFQDFNSSSAITASFQERTNTNPHNQVDNDFGQFEDFNKTVSYKDQHNINMAKGNSGDGVPSEASDNDFDGFQDFSRASSTENVPPIETAFSETNKEKVEDNWASFSKEQNIVSKERSETNENDDFDDFATFSNNDKHQNLSEDGWASFTSEKSSSVTPGSSQAKNKSDLGKKVDSVISKHSSNSQHSTAVRNSNSISQHASSKLHLLLSPCFPHTTQPLALTASGNRSSLENHIEKAASQGMAGAWSKLAGLEEMEEGWNLSYNSSINFKWLLMTLRVTYEHPVKKWKHSSQDTQPSLSPTSSVASFDVESSLEPTGILMPEPAGKFNTLLKPTLLAQSQSKEMDLPRVPSISSLKKGDSGSETTSETASLDLDFFSSGPIVPTNVIAPSNRESGSDLFSLASDNTSLESNSSAVMKRGNDIYSAGPQTEKNLSLPFNLAALNKATPKQEISPPAQKFLDSLEDLRFMNSTVLMFPSNLSSN